MPGTKKRLRVVDLETGRETASLPLTPQGEAESPYDWGVNRLRFEADGRVIGGGSEGLRRFDLAKGHAEWLWRTDRKTSVLFAVSNDVSRLIAAGRPSRSSNP